MGETAAIEIQAVKVADMELDDECIIERSMVVSRAPERMPFVGLKGRYNKRWYVDIIAFPDNSVRRQMSDLFTTFTAMYKMSLDLTESDFELFYKYLAAQCDFYKALIEAEEVALYSHIHGEISLRRLVRDSQIQVLNSDFRLAIKKEIFGHLNDALQHRYTLLPAMQMLGEIRNSIDLFAKKVLDYFADKERNLPKLLSRSLRGSKEKTRYEARLISYLLGKPQGYLHVVLLLQTLTNQDVREEFMQRHFPKQEQRSSFENAATIVHEDILKIPASIQLSAQRYEKRFSMRVFMKHYGRDNEIEDAIKVIT